MSREDFLKEIDARYLSEEIIDGVKVVHKGEKFQRSTKDSKGKLVDVLEMYDANGNKFYSNYSSLEEAEEAVKRLRAEGKEAIIGPKAPCRGENGKIIRNQSESAVAVYIVKTIEEKENDKSGKEPGE